MTRVGDGGLKRSRDVSRSKNSWMVCAERSAAAGVWGGERGPGRPCRVRGLPAAVFASASHRKSPWGESPWTNIFFQLNIGSRSAGAGVGGVRQ